MADASAANAVSGLRNDPLFTQMQASLNKLIADLGRLRMFVLNRVSTTAGTFSGTVGLTDGASSGMAKTTGTITYLVGGVSYVKVATDNLFDLTSLSYDASLYTGVLFLLSSQGTGSITSATSTSAALAIQSVLVKHTDTTKSVVGAYVANPGSTFSNSALTAMGSFNQNITPDLQAYVCNWG